MEGRVPASATTPHCGDRTPVDSSPDRITTPWAARTPCAPGDPWPARIDLHLADGVTGEDVERWVPSVSILHFHGDAMDTAHPDRCESYGEGMVTDLTVTPSSGALPIRTARP